MRLRSTCRKPNNRFPAQSEASKTPRSKLWTPETLNRAWISVAVREYTVPTDSGVAANAGVSFRDQVIAGVCCLKDKRVGRQGITSTQWGDQNRRYNEDPDIRNCSKYHQISPGALDDNSRQTSAPAVSDSVAQRTVCCAVPTHLARTASSFTASIGIVGPLDDERVLMQIWMPRPIRIRKVGRDGSENRQ